MALRPKPTVPEPGGKPTATTEPPWEAARLAKLKARGALSNAPSRYDQDREAVDDGWQNGRPDLAEDPLPPLPTTVTLDSSKSIITRNTSPDIGFDRSINPYRGCEHGCIYCFARPTHAYLGLSPGLDFETRLMAKPDAPRLLEQELRRKGYLCRPIAIGTNTDPYQPVERQRRIMRGILEVLDAFNHPVTITTKSALVCRDLDILKAMARRNLVQVGISLTTLDRGLARIMEPRAATPAARLGAIESLAAAGIPTVVMVAPVIPAVNDPEIEAILAAAAGAGARDAGYVLLRLPLEVGPLFEEWLRSHFPDRAERVLALVRQTRDGALYRSDFGLRQSGSGSYAKLIADRFTVALRRMGMGKRRLELDVSAFKPPPAKGDQLRLF